MKIRTMCGYVDKENIWIPSFDKNVLFKGKLSDGICEVENIPFEGEIYRFVRRVYKCDEKLYFFTPYTCCVAIYDVKEKKENIWNYHDKKYVQISDVLYNKGICWIVPSDLNFPIIRMDLRTRKTQEIYTGLNNQNFTRGMISGSRILIASRSKNRPIVSVLETSTYKTKNIVLQNLKKIENIYADEESLFVLGIGVDERTKVVQVKIEKETIEYEYECDFDLPDIGNGLSYIKMLAYGKKFLLVSDGVMPHRVFSLDRKDSYVIDIPQKSNVFETQQEENQVYFFIRNRGEIAVFDFDSMLYEEIELDGRESNIKLKSNYAIHTESEYDTLDDFLRII